MAFSSGIINTPFEFRGTEFYSTPYIVTKFLLNRISFNKKISILEPCCGSLAIVKILKEYKYKNITYFDLHPQNKKIKQQNFLLYKKRHDVIITNPPFSKTYGLLIHSLNIANTVIFFLPLDYLHGKKRYNMFYKRNFLDKVLIFTRRINLSENPNIYILNGLMTLAWFIFDKKSVNKKPTIEFIDAEGGY